MQTYTYVSKGKFELMEKPKPVLMHERDAIVKVTCTLSMEAFHGQCRGLQSVMRWLELWKKSELL